MYRLIVLVLLAGCVAKAPATVAGFRDPAKQIYSNAVLENDKLVGRWAQVAEFAPIAAPECKLGGAEIGRGAAGLTLVAQLCLGGERVAFSGPLAGAGPGRFTPPKGEAWWVLWADVGYRTLVIGTPSGRFGFILNRGGDLPADRMRAAREVLDWNGYTLARLR
ncbi:lipocalin family protein [Pseudorhodobacter ferrugineus]|uniref:lipocalin family protein n=1 Tax=Pseudorhodobacter ferrugineus TaxID=77008 RepID=UPI0003B61778|nr:lipocalin family protein [Pseudorhodobacter ferrugineus]